MKILFLDIDGVLNSEQYYKTVNRSIKNWSRFDPSAIELVKKLVEEFSLKIVITSTWRFGAVKMLNEELKKSGLIKYLHKDWVTPQIYPPNRGKEIKHWLDNHAQVRKYIIIDDSNEITDDQLSWFVKTDLRNGLQIIHYELAKNIFLDLEKVYK